MTTFEQAVKYLDLGLSVFPLEPNGKRPAVKTWTPFQTTRMSEAAARVVFKEGANIAIALGGASHNLIVIDVDEYKKATGKDIDSPMMVFTPRGGRHAYFKSTKEIRNTVNQNLAIDIRAWGGYVAAPASVTSDGMYRWKVEPTVELIASVPEVDQALLDEIYKLNEKGMNGTSPKFDVGSAIGLTEGGRNDTLHRMALSLLAKHSQDEAWKLVLATNNTYSPPMDLDEVQTLFNSAVKQFNISPPQKANERVKENTAYKFRTFDEQVESAGEYILKGMRVGIRSGMPNLDAITGGFQLGQSYLGYADTSVGKSIWLLNMLIYMAQHGEKVMYFDLENTFESMTAERMLLILKQGNMTKAEWELLSKEQKKETLVTSLKGLPFAMWDQSQLGEKFGNVVWKDNDGRGVINCIEEGVRQGVRVFAIDHLHYFDGAETDHARLASVAKDINDLCARHNICIIMVAHTKKGLITEKNGRVKASRPTIDSVSGSGMIGRHTKNLIGLHRNILAEELDDQKILTVYVDKTKNGPTGQVVMDFNPYSLVITDWGSYPSAPPPKQQPLIPEKQDEFVSTVMDALTNPPEPDPSRFKNPGDREFYDIMGFYPDENGPMENPL